eukprot:jgi/Botrbrau1/12592/Bobra.0169s0120.1
MRPTLKAQDLETLGLSQIERERIERIALNKEKLDQCKVQLAAAELAASATPRARTMKIFRARKKIDGAYERRISMRSRNKPAPKYRDVFEVEGRTVMRTKAASRKRPPTASTWTGAACSLDAMEAARQAARGKAEGIGHSAFVKDMLPSHVSGGFWLQAPMDLFNILGWKDKRSIWLRSVSDTRSREPDYEYCGDVARREWECVWLPRPPNGAGLSGGWRGFSLDHELTPNDSLVFEVVADQAREKLLQVYIFRGWDFESSLDCTTQRNGTQGDVLRGPGLESSITVSSSETSSFKSESDADSEVSCDSDVYLNSDIELKGRKAAQRRSGRVPPTKAAASTAAPPQSACRKRKVESLAEVQRVSKGSGSGMPVQGQASQKRLRGDSGASGRERGPLSHIQQERVSNPIVGQAANPAAACQQKAAGGVLNLMKKGRAKSKPATQAAAKNGNEASRSRGKPAAAAKEAMHHKGQAPALIRKPSVQVNPPACPTIRPRSAAGGESVGVNGATTDGGITPPPPLSRPASAAAGPRTPAPLAVCSDRRVAQKKTRRPTNNTTGHVGTSEPDPHHKNASSLPSSRNVPLTTPTSSRSSDANKGQTSDGSDVEDLQSGSASDLDPETSSEGSECSNESDADLADGAGAQLPAEGWAPKGSMWNIANGSDLPRGFVFVLGLDPPDADCCSALPGPQADEAIAAGSGSGHHDGEIEAWRVWRKRSEIPALTLEYLMVRGGCRPKKARAISRAMAEKASEACAQQDKPGGKRMQKAAGNTKPSGMGSKAPANSGAPGKEAKSRQTGKTVAAKTLQPPSAKGRKGASVAVPRSKRKAPSVV